MMLTLQEISAHIEIRQVLAAYARGVDRCDADLLKSCYHEDATDQHTMFNGTGHAFADFIVDFCTKMGGTSLHQITSVHIDLKGARADVESYYIAMQQFRDAEGSDRMLVAGGRYLDRFEERGGAWKIAKRICTMDCSREPFPNEPSAISRDFPKVGPKGVDPLYALFSEA
jgi:hypothetical protein